MYEIKAAIRRKKIIMHRKAGGYEKVKKENDSARDFVCNFVRVFRRCIYGVFRIEGQAHRTG